MRTPPLQGGQLSNKRKKRTKVGASGAVNKRASSKASAQEGGGNLSRSRKQARRLSVVAAIPAIMAASATGVTNAVTNFVQQTTVNVTSSVSHLVTGRFTSTQVTPVSGGQYWFGPAWRDYANESRESAVTMAADVVRLAQKKANVHLTPEENLHWNQWVLAGNVDPLQASDILAGDDNNIATAKLNHLAEEMVKNSLPKWTHDSNYQMTDAAAEATRYGLAWEGKDSTFSFKFFPEDRPDDSTSV